MTTSQMTTLTPQMIKDMQEVNNPSCKWSHLPEEFWSFLTDSLNYVYWQVSTDQYNHWTKSLSKKQSNGSIPDDLPFEVGIGSACERYLGGESGTGLYGDLESHYQKSSTDDPEFEQLEKALHLFWPDMPMSTFNRIKPLITEQRQRREFGYYATTSDYEDDYVDAIKLFRVLKFANKLTPSPEADIKWEDVVNPPAPQTSSKSRKSSKTK